MRKLDKRAFTVSEVAKILSLGKTTVYELIWQNKLKHIKIGRKIIIPEAAIQEFIEANTKTNKEWKEEEWNGQYNNSKLQHYSFAKAFGTRNSKAR